MSIDVLKANVRAVVFVKIELDGLTLRYATENIIAKDTDNVDYFWEGRIIDLSPINAGFNDFRSSQTVVSSMQVKLANGKDSASGSSLDTYISSYFWGNKPVTIMLGTLDEATSASLQNFSYFYRAGPGQYVGPSKRTGSGAGGPTAASITLQTADIIFKGILSFPDVFSTYNEQTVEFNVFDSRYLDQVLVAKNVFSRDRFNAQLSLGYAAMKSGVESKQIPVIYGDFSDTEQIPGYGIAGFPSGVVRTYQLADETLVGSGQNPLHSITSVIVKDIGFAAPDAGPVESGCVQVTVATTPVAGVTVANYDANTADVYCACKGKTRGTAIVSIFGGSADSLLEHPVEVVYDLLVTMLQIDSTLIDSTSFLAAYNVDTGVVCRRWIGEQETIVTVLDELCFEFALELYSILGKYYLNSQNLAGTAGYAFDQDDLEPGSYEIRTDPNRNYFNKLTLKFKQNPYLNQFSSANTMQYDSKIAAHGRTQPLALELNWNYVEVHVVDRFGWLLYLYAQPVKMIVAKLRQRAWGILPTNFFTFTYHIFAAEKMMARMVSKNLLDFSTTITAWDTGTINIKNWADVADADPSSYSNAQALTYGVWHADNTIITGFNNTLNFTTDSTYTATVVAGTYTSAASLATAIQTAMNTVSVVRPVTVTYNSTTRKFTIATVGATNFSLNWTTTAEIGRSILGFDVASNDTGAATYTSDYLCIFDLASDAVTQWG